MPDEENSQPTAITTWRAAAAALGISYDTLWRMRRKKNDRTETPWWQSREELIAWWKALIAPPAPPPPRKPASRVRTLPGPLNARAKVRELIEQRSGKGDKNKR
jgi:hypothetical protein